MRINYATSVSSDDIKDINFDFIICSSGYENRSQFFYSKMKNSLTEKSHKICFSFRDQTILSKVENDIFFSDHGFSFIDYKNDNLHETITQYQSIFATTEKTKLKILVDYSSMTKILYAAILKYFSLLESEFSEVSIYFTYTQAKYSDPPTYKSVLHNQPITLFPNIELTDEKTALIINLGYEDGKAQGVIEYLQVDTVDIYPFITSKINEESYYSKIEENNRYLLNKIPIENRFEFELQNINMTFSLVESLCQYLISRNYRVIIAPLGPKVFSLISILLNLKYNDLTVLRVSDGTKGQPIDRVANQEKEFVILEANFVCADSKLK